MDYNNKDWYYSPQTYPFYAPYQMQMQAGLPMQMQGNYLKEMEYEKDLDRIMDKIAQDSEKDEVETSECCGGSRRGGGLSDLVEVLLYNEMYRRRCRHRRCNRWW